LLTLVQVAAEHLLADTSPPTAALHPEQMYCARHCSSNSSDSNDSKQESTCIDRRELTCDVVSADLSFAGPKPCEDDLKVIISCDRVQFAHKQHILWWCHVSIWQVTNHL
jgi:hypothetical protein